MTSVNELIYATTNRAKLDAMREMLTGLPILLTGLPNVVPGISVPNEDGADPMANAVIKATFYYETYKRPLFSLDSGLVIDGLPDSEQPGAHVREINGRRLNDDEMIDHYANLARRMGGRLCARYINAVCLILNESRVITHTGVDISYEPFYIIDTPHAKRKDGFPLDSLSVHINTGKYYYDMNDTESLSLKTTEGFQRFFREALSLH